MLDSQCLGGRCLPDAAGTLACHDVCAPLGAPCLANEDCCSESCVGSPGSLVCAPAGESGQGATCAAPGAACDPTDAICCGGTLCAVATGGTTACAPLDATNP